MRSVVDVLLARITQAELDGLLNSSDAQELSEEWSNFKLALGTCSAPVSWLLGPRNEIDGCSLELWDTLTNFSLVVTSRLGLDVPFVKSYLDRNMVGRVMSEVLDPTLDLHKMTYNDLHIFPKTPRHVGPITLARRVGVLGTPPGLPSAMTESAEGEKPNSRACDCTNYESCIKVFDRISYCEVIDGHCTLISDCL